MDELRARMRALIDDGPDGVHRDSVARQILRPVRGPVGLTATARPSRPSP